jgi:hypothetical protein
LAVAETKVEPNQESSSPAERIIGIRLRADLA